MVEAVVLLFLMRARNSFMTSLPIIRSSHEAQAFIISPAANSRVYPTSGLIRGTEIDVTTTSSSSSFEIGVSSSSSLTPQNISCSQLLNDSNQMSEQSILLDDADNNIVEVRSAEESYRRGLVTIGFITLLFAKQQSCVTFVLFYDNEYTAGLTYQFSRLDGGFDWSCNCISIT